MQVFTAAPIFSVELCITFLVAGFLLSKLANVRRQSFLITVPTYLAWSLSLAALVVVSTDLSAALHTHCLGQTRVGKSRWRNRTTCFGLKCTAKIPERLQAFLNSSPDVCSQCTVPLTFFCPFPLEIIWYIIYWATFVLNWILLLGFCYRLAIKFRAWKKFIFAFLYNMPFYLSFLIILLILFATVAVMKKKTDIFRVLTLLSLSYNTWGTLLLVGLVGYGLVEVPRKLWQTSKRNYTKKCCYIRASRLFDEMTKANNVLEEVNALVDQAARTIPTHHPLQRFLNRIIKVYPKDQQKVFLQIEKDNELEVEEALPPPGCHNFTEASLQILFKRAVKAIQIFKDCCARWSALTDQTLDLEDVQKNYTCYAKETISCYCFKFTVRRFQSSVRVEKSKWYIPPREVIEWYWKLWMIPVVYKVMAALLGILSVVIVWCEVSFGLHIFERTRFSVFGTIVFTVHNEGYYWLVEILSFFILLYISLCTYYAVFNLRYFGMYRLRWHHLTDESSLLFSAIVFTRLTIPICLNYLYMIQAVELKQRQRIGHAYTAFNNVVSDANLVVWLTSYFFVYYPTLILLVSLATVFGVMSRLCMKCNCDHFMKQDVSREDFIDPHHEKNGRALIERERILREDNNEMISGQRMSRLELPVELIRRSLHAEAIESYLGRPSIPIVELADATARPSSKCKHSRSGSGEASIPDCPAPPSIITTDIIGADCEQHVQSARPVSVNSVSLKIGETEGEASSVYKERKSEHVYEGEVVFEGDINDAQKGVVLCEVADAEEKTIDEEESLIKEKSCQPQAKVDTERKARSHTDKEKPRTTDRERKTEASDEEKSVSSLTVPNIERRGRRRKVSDNERSRKTDRERKIISGVDDEKESATSLETSDTERRAKHRKYSDNERPHKTDGERKPKSGVVDEASSLETSDTERRAKRRKVSDKERPCKADRERKTESGVIDDGEIASSQASSDANRRARPRKIADKERPRKTDKEHEVDEEKIASSQASSDTEKRARGASKKRRAASRGAKDEDKKSTSHAVTDNDKDEEAAS